MRSASVIDILGGANTLCSLAHSSITPVPRDGPGRNVRNPAARWPWGQERLALALGRIGPSSSTSAPRSNDMLAALTSRTIEKVLQSLVATRLLGASLHALSRDHPQLAVQINLAPSRAECLAGAGGGEDRKPKCLGAGRTHWARCLSFFHAVSWVLLYALAHSRKVGTLLDLALPAPHSPAAPPTGDRRCTSIGGAPTNRNIVQHLSRGRRKPAAETRQNGGQRAAEARIPGETATSSLEEREAADLEWHMIPLGTTKP